MRGPAAAARRAPCQQLGEQRARCGARRRGRRSPGAAGSRAAAGSRRRARRARAAPAPARARRRAARAAARGAVCSSSSGVAYGTISAGTPDADDLERGVVAALAHRRAGRRAARRRGRRTVRRSSTPGPASARERAATRRRAAAGRAISRIGDAGRGLRLGGGAQQRLADQPAARRDDHVVAARAAPSGARVADDEAGVVDRHAQRPARRERLLEAREARDRCARARRRGGRSASAARAVVVRLLVVRGG